MTKTKKSISPTMKLLKNAGFVRITFERRWSYRDDKFMWFEKNKGDFSYMKGTKDYYILEIRIVV